MGASIGRRAALAAVAAVVVAPVLGSSAVAELPVRPTESHIDRRLADVAVTGDDHDRLAAEYDAARSGREAMQLRATALRQDEEDQMVVVTEAEARAARARRRLLSAREALASMAVSAYVGIEGAEPVERDAAAVDVAIHAHDSRVVVAGIIGEDRMDRTAQAQQRLRAERGDLREAQDRLDATRAALVEVEAQLDRFLEAELNLGPELADARAVARVEGSDLTLVALDAYTSAEQATAESDPACGLEWELLAGIGRVESRHGTYGGTRLTPAGLTERRIIGIALDGGNGTARIGDTDGGASDGDAVFDRAVGPMQFIPSTWARWARDGDEDDVADPHDIYDAALTAAAYLCASGPGLDGPGGRDRALFSYNHSRAYVAKVASFADDYRSLGV